VHHGLGLLLNIVLRDDPGGRPLAAAECRDGQDASAF
jgi:hypothetical protein